MAGPRATRLQVGSAPWVAEERSSAQQIANSEVEEFSFSARNDFEWLNEHMAEIFSENQINVAEIFKTPGKLRGKTPRTIRKANVGEARVPLSDIFSATPKHAPNPFAIPNLERNQSPRVKIAADPTSHNSPERIGRPISPSKNAVSIVDSGYHGSQPQDFVENDDYAEAPLERSQPARPQRVGKGEHVAFQLSSPERVEQSSPVRHSPDPTVGTVGDDPSTQYFTAHGAKLTSPTMKTAHHGSTTPAGSPAGSSHKSSPIKSSPQKPSVATEQHVMPSNEDDEAGEAGLDETARSPSDGSSPIAPKFRKSSLNFASLPAREPIVGHKSIGNRVSRTSHLDQNRNSYYHRHTGGKSLGNVRHETTDDENDDMDIGDEVEQVAVPSKPQEVEPANTATHNKTYTQRLQDQISKLGQSQANPSRPSKSIANTASLQPTAAAAPVAMPKSSPKPKPAPSPKTHTTPGAFPEDDDDDDWIRPLGPPDNASSLFSPRPGMPKSYSTEVMEGIAGKQSVSGADFALPKTRQPKSPSRSPHRPLIPERTTSTLSHHKSASVPAFPLLETINDDGGSVRKAISVSNPALPTVSESGDFGSPSKSPSRAFRDSPLKQVKNKLSSIFVKSKGILASSAAISAEGKSSLLSPSTTRLGLHGTSSTLSLDQPFGQDLQPLYPDLSRQAADVQTLSSTASPSRTENRKTRASIEREKADEKRKEKEAKEARRLAEQMEKLEKIREKEREKARVFSKEQERVTAMEKQVAAQKEQEKIAPTAAPIASSPSRPTRTSPRKAKAAEPRPDDDVEMADAPGAMAPPSVPRSAASSSAMKNREIKRPMRPTKEPTIKAKQAPTVIRVNMGSQHSQSSTGRPKALELAARRKEQEEREAQRKRDAKAEMERKRAAVQEEERRQEQQRKIESERQREEDRVRLAAQAEAKKNSQRQAMLEKAKQTRAPPAAARSQAHGQTPHANDSQPGRPLSRMNSNAHRSQEDLGRSVNGAKPAQKRQLPQEQKDIKRMRLTDEFDDDVEMEAQHSLKGAPVRPSSGFKKVNAATMLPQSQKLTKPQDMSNKSMFPAGYANAPQQSATRDLFKSTVTSQHGSQAKPAHPLDMAQVSKTAIPFAPNPNPAGQAHKTPARPAGVAGAKSTAKSATRSSPRFQNGEQIELPEINTDDEDEYDDEEQKQMFANWTDSPALRIALVEQETLDPMSVFGAPAPLNMEEVFSKSKDRWAKFRARTSSANWSGTDRLTEDDIRKDLAARDKLRREGAWTYEMSKEML